MNASFPFQEVRSTSKCGAYVVQGYLVELDIPLQLH